jgi:hypothetical protein
MTFVTIIGTIVFVAVILIALSAVFEIFFSSNKKKTNGAVDKKPTWFRKRRALSRRDDETREPTRESRRR